MWLSNQTRQVRIVPVQIADHFWTRLQGMLGARSDQPVPALWFPSCSSIHTVGMKFPLDVIFLDRNLRVVKMILKVPPGRWMVYCEKARSVLEIISGRWDTALISVADLLAFS